jgi:hypothetical protein
MYSSYSFTTSSLDGVNGQRHVQTTLYPRGETSVTHWTGDWVGFRAGLDTEVRGKISCLCRGSNRIHSVLQSVARHYTDWATSAPLLSIFHYISMRIYMETGSIKSRLMKKPSGEKWNQSLFVSNKVSWMKDEVFVLTWSPLQFPVPDFVGFYTWSHPSCGVNTRCSKCC